MKKRLGKIKDIIAVNAARSGKKHEGKDHRVRHEQEHPIGDDIPHEACSVSTGIHGGLTFGHGALDNNGFWEFPCGRCARAYEKKHPEGGECWPFKIRPSYKNLLDRISNLELALKEKEEELETERMRLAGCGVVARANTRDSVKKCRISKDSPYYSASMGDVEDAVNREMYLRSKLDQISALIKSG